MVMSIVHLQYVVNSNLLGIDRDLLIQTDPMDSLITPTTLCALKLVNCESRSQLVQCDLRSSTAEVSSCFKVVGTGTVLFPYPYFFPITSLACSQLNSILMFYFDWPEIQ